MEYHGVCVGGQGRLQRRRQRGVIPVDRGHQRRLLGRTGGKEDIPGGREDFIKDAEIGKARPLWNDKADTGPEGVWAGRNAR